MSTEELGDEEGSTGGISLSTALIYGQVVTVKPIPTRQVTQIIIEIPDEHHITATQILYNRNAFIMPCESKDPLPGLSYGVTTLGKAMNPPAQPEPVQREGNSELNIAQWLALKGKETNFQSFLGVDNEIDAAEKVRGICRVTSRGEIAHNAQANEIFMTQIYTPFVEKFPNRFPRINPWNRGSH